MTTLRHAFKEWAVICRALAEGRQALILRKGGIAETDDSFRVEQPRFWLYPTYLHQQADALVPGARDLLEQVERDRPPAGVVRLSHFAEVAGVYLVQDLATALKLTGLHLWSGETVRQRFAYRRPGLYVLPVRVWRAAEVVELTETAEYAGCRSWVELEQDLPTDRAVPVLDEETFYQLRAEVEDRLQPTALA
jgi:hypothetical protein